MAYSTLPAAAPLPPLPAPAALPLPPGGSYAVEPTPMPASGVQLRPGYEALCAELEALRSYVSALQNTATAPQLEPAAQLQRTLEREWARAKHYWLPLSLLVVQLIEPLRTPGLRDALAGRLAACCRDVDVAFELPSGGYAIIMLATNRTGAEAERLEIERALSDALLRETGMFPTEGAAMGLGLAVAFDETDSPDELLLLATERAKLRLQLPADELPNHAEIPPSEAIDSSATTLPRGFDVSTGEPDAPDSDDRPTLPIRASEAPVDW